MLEYKTVSMCASSDYCRGWNDAVKEMPKWISVKERMPPENENVLVYAVSKYGELSGPSRCVITKWKELAGRKRWYDPWLGFCIDYDITHWMPLPDAPEEEGE